MTIEEVAMGFIKVANEAMCRPIRALTQVDNLVKTFLISFYLFFLTCFYLNIQWKKMKAKGHDTSRHVLACFGGAGGQHACAIARSLGMQTVFVHKYAGILSAYGMALADVVEEAQEPSAETYNIGIILKLIRMLSVTT